MEGVEIMARKKSRKKKKKYTPKQRRYLYHKKICK